MDTALATIQVSTDVALSRTLIGLRAALENAAENSIRALEAQGEHFTGPERRAMKVIESLKMVNGMDLAALYMRHELIKEIEEEGLAAVHPAGYGRNGMPALKEMAIDQGISLSELSNIKDLCGVIFPYLQNELGMNIAEIWERIGKSNFREITPVLKSLITGEQSNHQSTREAVEQLLNNTIATIMATGEEITTEQARRIAAQSLIEQVSTGMTNSEVRRLVRPSRTPPIYPNIVVFPDGRHYMVVSMSEEQKDALERKLGTFMCPYYHYKDTPQDAIAEVRTIVRDHTEGLRNFYRIPQD